MNYIILDIHHHGSPLTNAVNSIMAGAPIPSDNCLYSLGIHPWQTDQSTDILLSNLPAEITVDPRIVAVGEAGIDRLRGADLAVQIPIFESQVEIASKLNLPLIVHNVRATDLILPIIKKFSDLKIIIHGFRGKSIEAGQLLDAGAFISLGQYFNTDTAQYIPDDRLLAETDESSLSISEIISHLADTRRTTTDDLKSIISSNIDRILNHHIR